MAKMRPIRGAPPELQRLRAHVRQLFLSKRVARSEDALRQILAIEPNDSQAHWQLASCLSGLRRLNEAFEHAKTAVALDPASVAALAVLAAAYGEVGQHEDSVSTYEQALRIKPDYVPAIFGLASALASKARWSEALEWTDRGLSIRPDHVIMLRIRAESLAALNRKEEALATMEQFLRIAPDRVESHAVASSIFKRVGETEKAIEFAQTALSMNPADPFLHNSLAQLKMKERLFDDADRHFKHAGEIYDSRRDGQKGSKQIEIKSLLGQAAINLLNRNFQLAESQYRRVVEIYPNHPLAPALLASTIGAQYRFDEALPMARAAFERQPTLLFPRLLLAAVLSDMERHDEAIALALECAQLHPDAPGPHRTLGGIYLVLEQHSSALAEAEKALAIRQEPFGKRLCATALAALGRREEAISATEAALREEPNFYYCQAAAGYIFRLLKEPDRAESHYRRAMELDPSGLGCHDGLGLLFFDQGRIAEARPWLEKSNSLNPYRHRIRAALAEIAN
jgi:tetratricopeptide (TPR) repeat protein